MRPSSAPAPPRSASTARSASSATAPTSPASSPRSTSSSGSPAARACPTSSPRPASPASPPSPRPTTARCQQIVDGTSGLFTPHEDPAAAAAAILRLVREPVLRRRLGAGLRAHVLRSYAAAAVVPQWQALFDDRPRRAAARPAADALPTASSTAAGNAPPTACRTGRRLDLIAGTGHDANAAADYRQLAGLGLRTMRDGLRWHLIEPRPGAFDFSSWTPMLAAAAGDRRAGHLGPPPLRLARRPRHLVAPPSSTASPPSPAPPPAHHREATDAVPFWCPVNEISFFAWAGGDAAYLNPFARGRGFELKVQLARAAIAAMHALRDVDPRARFVHCEPLIAIHHDPATGRPRWEAEGWHDAQYQAADLIAGRLWPQIGGEPGPPRHRRRQLLPDQPVDPRRARRSAPTTRSTARSPTCSSSSTPAPAARSSSPRPAPRATPARPGCAMVAGEVRRARARGVPVEGVCLYPVANHLGWDDDRLCENGLLGHTPIGGTRTRRSAVARGDPRRSAARRRSRACRSGISPIAAEPGGQR